MASLAQLRKSAKEMGIAPSVIRGAETAEELQAEIENFGSKSTAASKPKKKVVAKKKATASPAKKKSTTVAAKPKPKATTKTAARKTKPAAKSTQGKAKRSSAANDSGRNLLDDVNYSQTDGWNAREGSAPDRIIKALKKFRGNREKVFDFLVGDVWDFVGKKMADGTKRPLKSGTGNAHSMLAYRIARTDWDFAMRTGQHEKAENRVEYGTGGTGSGTWKPASARKSAARATARKSTARKSGSKTKAAASRKKVGRKTAGRR